MTQNCIKLLRILLPGILATGVYTAAAQTQTDTLRYTSQQAESIFLQNNLPLLAEKLNITQADAKILQAKAWPNPSFSLSEIQLYNNSTTDESPPLFGNFWSNRTFAAQLEQLVHTAGKRKKNIALETRNKQLAESSFTDLLQALKAEFRQTTSELLYLQRVQSDLLFQQSEVSTLMRAQQAQYKQGNISQTELYRLKALMISLQAEVNELNEQMTDKQKNLKTLMAVNPQSYLVLTDSVSATAAGAFRQHSLDDLISLAVKQNASILSARNGTQVSEAQLAIERANRVPDVTLNLNYDRNGNNQLNFLGAGFAMDLPIFNRNKGNIRAAQIEVQKSGLMEKNKIAEVSNSVVKTWQDLNKAITLYESIDKDYIDKLGVMTKGIIRNFTQRNMSLLEFLDFFESFRDSKGKYYEAIKNISLKKEDLNYLTGSDL